MLRAAIPLKPPFSRLRPKFRASVEVVGEVLLGAGVRAMLSSVVPSSLDTNESVASGNEVQEVRIKMLAANDADHGGAIVEMEAMDSEGKKGVWIKIPIELVNLVEAAIKVLVVQEKSGKFQGTGLWKFPTGVVEEGDDLCDAAVREVKGETGVVLNSSFSQHK